MPQMMIFGASRGLGRGLVEEHLRRGWRVLATVRDAEALADIRDRWGTALEVETVDTVDWAAVDRLRNRLDGRTFDLLFVNAAVSGPMQPVGAVDPEAFAEMIAVNSLAPLRIVDRFADLVPAEGTLAVMSSGLGSIAGNDSGGWEAYRMSKAALNMGLKSIAARRSGEGRTYLAVNPGWVRTDMGGPNASLAIEESVPRIADTLERRAGGGGVAFVNYSGEDLSW